MAVTNYFTVDGQILGEETASTYTGYLPDALGSVTATVSSAGFVENTYRYKPYGTLLAKTGPLQDPQFLWVGCEGYRRDSLNISDYVRARSLFFAMGHFNSTDGLYPLEHPYGYCNGMVTTMTDPTGFDPWITAQPFDNLLNCRWFYHCQQGESESCIKWQNVPNVDGWVIQRVDTTTTEKSCDPKKATTTTHKSHFYEAWCVKKSNTGVPIFLSGFCANQIDSSISGHDRWYLISSSGRGQIEVLGHAYFVAGTPREFLRYFKMYEPSPSRDLVSAIEYPHFKRGAPMLQALDHEWMCCPAIDRDCLHNVATRLPSNSFYPVNLCGPISGDSTGGKGGGNSDNGGRL